MNNKLTHCFLKKIYLQLLINNSIVVNFQVTQSPTDQNNTTNLLISSLLCLHRNGLTCNPYSLTTTQYIFLTLFYSTNNIKLLPPPWMLILSAYILNKLNPPPCHGQSLVLTLSFVFMQ